MLFKFVIAFIVVCVVFANARMVHMEQSIANEDFIRMEQADGNQIHEVIFSVKQRNIAALDQFLMEVSTPGSPKYGKYLTRAEVAAITANPTATSAIEAYLKKNGAEVVKKTPYGEYITAKAPISVWEKLFATTFYNFKHAENKVKPVPRAVHYSIDNELSDHVEAVFQTTQLPNIAPPKLPLRSSESVGVGGKITPAVLNSYYHITSNTGNTLGSQAVFESIGQYYSPSDLLTFEAQYGIPLYNVTTDIGGYEADAPCVEDPNNCIEANLDVQYLMAISQVTPTTYWYDGATDSFLDWIRAVASSENPPLVNSISYGATETALPKSIANAFNNEALKLGTMGVTVLVSSGDDGVAGNGARKNPSKCGYSPSFPATSQYVTAVGATQGAESGAAQETACLSNTGGVITTGGGFSTVFSAPAWQKDAIANYFKVATTPKSGYSTSGRGYPDVSLAGLNYEVVVGGKTYAVSGTSASAPSVAAMVALVNANRLAAGKSALGFLNPSIYAFGSKFSNDVVTGENNCTAGQVCCSEGFYSAAGWDPVTGFGSVDFAKFNAIFAAL